MKVRKYHMEKLAALHNLQSNALIYIISNIIER